MNWLLQKTLGLFVKTNGMLSAPLFGGIGHIFMLHRVLPEPERNRYLLNREMAITPEHLEHCILYLKKKNCRFISLDELLHILQQKIPQKQKCICLTLDDGYKDNLTYGLPVFEKHQIPVTIYVTNCFPEKAGIMWWYHLEKHLSDKNMLFIPGPNGGKNYHWNNPEEGKKLFPAIRNDIRKIPKSIFSDSLHQAFGRTPEDDASDCEQEALTWAEIISLSRHPLVTIGAHTLNHLSLRNLTEEDLKQEITESKKQLEEKIGKPVVHFAYPYGGPEDAYLREYRAAKDAGFLTAVLNYPGNIFFGHASCAECMPRMPLGNSTDTNKLEQILNGIMHFGYNGFHKVALPPD